MSAIEIQDGYALGAPVQHPAQPRLKVVHTPERQAPRRETTPRQIVRPERSRQIVRPDRPRTTGAPALFAVPTAPSPSSTEAVSGVWRVQSAPYSYRHAASVTSDFRHILSEGVQYINHVRVALRLKSVVGFTALMAVSILAGLLIVAIFGLFPAGGTIHIVQPGDTLVSIASAINAPVDTTEVIADIYSLNAIEEGRIFPGQELVIPHY
ncbi:LysM peptidoglycan-binding domain-containing protein [Arcanobacterium pinnipediorum]|uniref:LysM peptidoglycan-binding domain-containing protein n=1 Tax=Arcanobacterium pinnipediorum TaxID=1503041 RepID=A0ABY5AII8_9ACTO|nr:LysM peptidoglycan-binding domain-containing protein [Arcanobacterium pinnipediorum]USR80014.1 LysM peptidoglycan-binding domain-containing protein [Arcanobacterium pinnipediorum]